MGDAMGDAAVLRISIWGDRNIGYFGVASFFFRQPLRGYRRAFLAFPAATCGYSSL